MLPLTEITRSFTRLNIGLGDVIVLNGGETTVYPGLMRLVEQAAQTGAKVVLYTNGRRLANFGFAQQLVLAGVTRFTIPLYGVKPEQHDLLTQNHGSFRQTVTGIQNVLALRKAKQEIELELKCLMCRPCLYTNPQIVDLVNTEFRGVDLFVVSGLLLSEKLLANRQDLVPTWGEFQKSVNETVAKAIYSALPTLLVFVPLCLLDEGLLRAYLDQVACEELYINKRNSKKKAVYFDVFQSQGIERGDMPRSQRHADCVGCKVAPLCSAYAKLIDEIPISYNRGL